MSAARRRLNRELRVAPRVCELGMGWRAVGFDVCWGRASCWHERRKRSAGGSLLNPANLMASCSPCNSLVEDQPAEARRLGFVVRPGDPEWDGLAA